ncbi:hypothetical protein ACFFWC_12705 [Plantactinospora siamensis]|uniref:PadR family transcriptional regulator n=1 Tax=Plantactinospora siamensis TaxID=555372 RepID=A0ABV6P2V9_9ACTN
MAGDWTTSDAWVFASIEGTGPEDAYSLTQIVVKAEGINHSLLREDEFNRAIARLVSAGLVGADPHGDRYWHTEAGRALYRRRMRRRGLFGWMDTLPPALRRLGAPQDGPWSLPPGAFEDAVEQLRQKAAE